jgi:hypothetical protein
MTLAQARPFGELILGLVDAVDAVDAVEAGRRTSMSGGRSSTRGYCPPSTHEQG